MQYKKIVFILLFNALFALPSEAQLAFENVAGTVGTNYAYGSTTYGGGVSFVDFDNDGWDDITYATEAGTEIYFLKNNNGVFTSVTLNGISNTLKTKQVIWIDYDNDGDKDFFATAFEGSNKFYRNDGSMNFTDISSSIGFFEDDLLTYGASFSDIDNDGDLDAFISNRDLSEVQRNYLYRNDAGIYVDITNAAGIPLDSQLSFCSIFFDYNKDGYQDIYVSNDKLDQINRLYKNNGDGTFDDVSVSSGAGIRVSAMTTTLGDYNTDGWFDIYVTNTPTGNQLLQNNGDGTFTDRAMETGTVFYSLSWGAVFLDADNDGLLDLYVSGGLDGSISSLLPSAFYHQQSDGTFVIPTSIGFETDTRESYSNAIGDINNDGKPDITVGNDTETNFLWENKTTNTNNWLKVKLEGVTTNKDGVGNTIEINVNGQSQYRYTLAGEGYLAQNSFYEFFGIGTASVIDYIKITWTGTGQVETINNVTSNQTIVIKQGSGILSTSNEVLLDDFIVYPNPSKSGIFLLNQPIAETISVSVYDVTGKKITSYKINQNELDISHLDSGVYILKLQSGKKTSIKKLIKS